MQPKETPLETAIREFLFACRHRSGEDASLCAGGVHDFPEALDAEIGRLRRWLLHCEIQYAARWLAGLMVHVRPHHHRSTFYPRDVLVIQLGGGFAGEQGFERPCVVIWNRDTHMGVVPLCSKEEEESKHPSTRRHWSTHDVSLKLPEDTAGMSRESSRALVAQYRVISRERIRRRLVQKLDNRTTVRVTPQDFAVLRHRLVAVVYPELLTQMKSLSNQVEALKSHDAELEAAIAETAAGRTDVPPPRLDSRRRRLYNSLDQG